jgi:hypothetical protein
MELSQAIFFLLGLPVFSISFLLAGRFIRDIGHA